MEAQLNGYLIAVDEHHRLLKGLEPEVEIQEWLECVPVLKEGDERPGPGLLVTVADDGRQFLDASFRSTPGGRDIDVVRVAVARPTLIDCIEADAPAGEIEECTNRSYRVTAMLFVEAAEFLKGSFRCAFAETFGEIEQPSQPRGSGMPFSSTEGS